MIRFDKLQDKTRDETNLTPNEFINHSPNRKRMAFDPNRIDKKE